MTRAFLQRARRLSQATRGAAAVEFAIVVPFLAAMLIGVIQYGGMIIANQQMHDGVSAAAVYVMRGGSDATNIKSIATSTWPNPPSDAKVTVSQFCSCAGVTSSCSSQCPDLSYPQGYTTIAATGTYTGVWGNQAMSTTQTVRTQ